MKVNKYNKHILGLLAEKLAEDYIKSLGMKIVEKNFRTRYGEIDIIALDKEYYVFVEVRSKTNVSSGLPEETVSKRKQEKIINMAKWYIYTKKLSSSISCRFDVVSIIFDKSNRNILKHDIKYIKNAFSE